jgi:hypothetical protein
MWQIRTLSNWEMDMRKFDFGTIAITGVMLVAATPAFAGVPPSPAPVVGLGLAGMAALAVGYRVLRRRFK